MSNLPAVPDLQDRETWLQPATPDEATRLARLAHSVVYDTTPPAASARQLGEMLAARYSVGELRYAVRELAYDPELEDKRRYSREGQFALRPADFERVISERHQLIHQLGMKLSEQERDRLILKWPRELSQDDFACCGFDRFNQPVWIYAPGMQKGRTVAAFLTPEDA